ncbi:MULTISPECIES: hypothetical protein [unclassified Sphingobium]|uniref:hypothetical protein n=1 Tax=unclassified Sphingobium TaxID=2611147 RepID=UPI001919045B|nr:MULTISPECIES: hypothetical protein [unclassified Sphingobium]CAD7337126.1 hypothetical protein SPHS6_01365 [Sphingobium sp. S6]CAD7337183.1 hypothetical protein SPHS8_01402 [Sphingobium sp. S8]
MVIREGCLMGEQSSGRPHVALGGFDHRWLLPGQTHFPQELKLEQISPFFLT